LRRSLVVVSGDRITKVLLVGVWIIFLIIKRENVISNVAAVVDKDLFIAVDQREF